MSGSSYFRSEKKSLPDHGGSHQDTDSDFISNPEGHRSEEISSAQRTILGASSTLLTDDTSGNSTAGSFGSDVSSRTSVTSGAGAGRAAFSIASGLASLALSGLSALRQSVYYSPSWDEIYRNDDLCHMKIDGQYFKQDATFFRDYAPNMRAYWYLQGHVLAYKDNVMGWLALWVENAIEGTYNFPRDYRKRSTIISGYIDEPLVIEYVERELRDTRSVWSSNAEIPILKQQNWVSTGDIDDAWARDSLSVERLCGKGVILHITSLDMKRQMRLVADEMVKKGREMALAAKQDV